MNIIIYHSLVSDALFLRKTVFVEEQGFVDDEDAIDAMATHLVAYDDRRTPIAACRLFPDGEEGVFALGRFCVVKEMRGRGIGQRLLAAAEREIALQGGRVIVLHSQLHAQPFYEKQGYIPEGEIEYEQGQPHRCMKKTV